MILLSRLYYPRRLSPLLPTPHCCRPPNHHLPVRVFTRQRANRRGQPHAAADAARRDRQAGGAWCDAGLEYARRLLQPSRPEASRQAEAARRQQHCQQPAPLQQVPIETCLIDKKVERYAPAGASRAASSARTPARTCSPSTAPTTTCRRRASPSPSSRRHASKTPVRINL